MPPSSSERSAVRRLAPVRRLSTRPVSSASIASTRCSICVVAERTLPTCSWLCADGVVARAAGVALRLATGCGRPRPRRRARCPRRSTRPPRRSRGPARRRPGRSTPATTGGTSPATRDVGAARRRSSSTSSASARQVGVDRLGLVPAPADGEVALLDALTVQGHGRNPSAQAGRLSPSASRTDEAVADQAGDRPLEPLELDAVGQRGARRERLDDPPADPPVGVLEALARTRARALPRGATTSTRPPTRTRRDRARAARRVPRPADRRAELHHRLARARAARPRGRPPRPLQDAADVRVDRQLVARRRRTRRPRPPCTARSPGSSRRSSGQPSRATTAHASRSRSARRL